MSQLSSKKTEFRYSHRDLNSPERWLQRFFEILPGATSWFILLGMLLLSFFNPLAAAVLIISFDLYWLFRLFYMTIFLLLSYFRLSCERETDWMARVKGIDKLAQYRKELENRSIKGDLRRRVSFMLHKKEIEALFESREPPPPSKQIYHLIIIPVASEAREIVEPNIASLAAQTFPTKQIVVVFALEERATKAVERDVEELRTVYREVFYDLLLVKHPSDLPGEARVKGANATYTAREAALFLERHEIPFDRVVVSCFDADTVVDKSYFACLTYHFMTCPHRTRASFQPIPVYHNNIWNVPGFARVLDVGASFFQMIEATNPEGLVTFSSHSMSFKALVDIDFWPVDMISDDSAIFWKALFHFKGGYRVIPMYVTLSMNVAEAETWWKTAINVYKQKRRWAWGVENFPIVMRAFLRTREISFYNKFRYAFKLFESNIAWTTWPFLMGVIGLLPALFAGREFSDSVLYYSAPRITGIIFRLASIALLTTIILSLSLLPKKNVRHSFWKRVSHAFEWLFIPAIVIFLSAVPALDAQTRLMLGRRMEFWVTEKAKSQKVST